MTPFTTHTGIAAPLPMPNVNTDMLIRVEVYMYVPRGQLGPHCLATLKEDHDCILNQPPYDHASILVAGENFGCGSSREHAVWALLDMGVRCVIAPSFGDIFYNNCFQNGLLPIVLYEKIVAGLRAETAESFTVDLEAQTIRTSARTLSFDIDPVRRQALLAGLDEIEMTLARDGDIAQFQAVDRTRRPWIYDFK